MTLLSSLSLLSFFKKSCYCCSHANTSPLKRYFPEVQRLFVCVDNRVEVFELYAKAPKPVYGSAPAEAPVYGGAPGGGLSLIASINLAAGAGLFYFFEHIFVLIQQELLSNFFVPLESLLKFHFGSI